jgi:hypothetical protein
MHKTNTVHYAVVYEGEMWLELDNGETLHLKRWRRGCTKRDAARLAEYRRTARYDAVFLERCKGRAAN